TDLSARSDRATDRAGVLVRQFAADLVAVHVLEQSAKFHAIRRKRFSQSFQPDAQLLESVRGQLCDDLRNMGDKVALRIVDGDPPETILKLAKAEGCDFIVTGVARNETFGRLTLGKTVDRLLRASELPLLIVTDKARAPYRGIIVAADFSHASRQAL